jgi:hypothetical protein
MPVPDNVGEQMKRFSEREIVAMSLFPHIGLGDRRAGGDPTQLEDAS